MKTLARIFFVIFMLAYFAGIAAVRHYVMLLVKSKAIGYAPDDIAEAKSFTFWMMLGFWLMLPVLLLLAEKAKGKTHE